MGFLLKILCLEILENLEITKKIGRFIRCIKKENRAKTMTVWIDQRHDSATGWF